MGVLIDVQVDAKELERFLKDLERRAMTAKKSLAPLLQTFVDKDIMSHFERERGPDGKWKEWSESYDKAMTRRGKGLGKKLQDSGNLRKGFRPENYRFGADSIIWFNNAQTKSGFGYAEAHDKGGPRLPRRSFMWLSEDAMNKIEKASLKWLVGE